MLTAHAGEEEGASCVEMCMEVLKVDRIDHGVRCMEDPAVVAKLKAKQTPCTVCPISNHRAQVGASQAASRWLSTRLDYDTYSY